jgi:hypothetical protein
MTKYLIHVGPHKTGTTYLQFRFDAARQRLRQGGVVYPAEWSSTETEPSHRKLMIALRDGHVGQLKSQFETIDRDEPDYVLISGEGINLLEQPALELFKTLVGGHSVTIIFYCRRWSELLPSFWQEEVKHGSDETFPEFFAHKATDPFDSTTMNFGKRLRLYADVFGRKNIRLVSYSNLSDEGIDIAKHFFDSFLPHHRALIDGLPALPLDRPNRSFPVFDVEAIRALNFIHKNNGELPGPTLRGWYMANASRFDLTGLHAAMRDNITTLQFSDASAGAQQLQEMLSVSYGDLMVQPATPRRLFSPRQADIVHIRQDYLTDAVSRQVLEDLYAAFRRETDPAP